MKRWYALLILGIIVLGYLLFQAAGSLIRDAQATLQVKDTGI
jgi:hypothetical protein